MMLQRHILLITIILIPCVSSIAKAKNDTKKPREKYVAAEDSSDPGEWRVIESLVEKHPFIVPILNKMRNYICTGSTISKKCILTSGVCIEYEPKYVVVNTAIYNKKMNNSNVFSVQSTIIHSDYKFELNEIDPNKTKIHSNIGLVFVERPIMDLFINLAELGNFYAPELINKEFMAIGFGSLDTPKSIGLQYQRYTQMPCLNPKWYYCICGGEHSGPFETYIGEFGIGAPVLFDSTLVAIVASPCGTLTMKNLNLKYNIFTIIGPYLPWIEKATQGKTRSHLTYLSSDDDTVGNSNARINVQQKIYLSCYYLIFIMISKIFL